MEEGDSGGTREGGPWARRERRWRVRKGRL